MFIKKCYWMMIITLAAGNMNSDRGSIDLINVDLTPEQYKSKGHRKLHIGNYLMEMVCFRSLNICLVPTNTIDDFLSCNNGFYSRIVVSIILLALYIPTPLAYLKIIVLPFSPVVSTLILSTLSSLPIIIGMMISAIRGDQIDYATRFMQFGLSIFLPVISLLRDFGIIWLFALILLTLILSHIRHNLIHILQIYSFEIDNKDSTLYSEIRRRIAYRLFYWECLHISQLVLMGCLYINASFFKLIASGPILGLIAQIYYGLFSGCKFLVGILQPLITTLTITILDILSMVFLVISVWEVGESRQINPRRLN